MSLIKTCKILAFMYHTTIDIFLFSFRKFASMNKAVGNVFTIRTLRNANPNYVRIRANLHLEVSRTSTNSFVRTDKISEFRNNWFETATHNN